MPEGKEPRKRTQIAMISAQSFLSDQRVEALQCYLSTLIITNNKTQVANIGTNLRPRSASRNLRASFRSPGKNGILLSCVCACIDALSRTEDIYPLPVLCSW